MRTHFTPIFSAILLALVACGGSPSTAGSATPAPASAAAPEPAPAPAPAAQDALVASLKRTACHGFCPIYTIEVYRDGKLKYHGERFVKTVGDATGQVDATTVAAIDAAFAKIEIDKLQSAYEHHDATDMPSAVLVYEKDGKRTTVSHYHGDRSAPASLVELEKELDRLVHIEQFIGTPEERAALNKPPQN